MYFKTGIRRGKIKWKRVPRILCNEKTPLGVKGKF